MHFSYIVNLGQIYTFDSNKQAVLGLDNRSNSGKYYDDLL